MAAPPPPLLINALGEASATRLAPHLVPVQLPKNTALFVQGRVADSLYLLTEGRLAVSHQAGETTLVIGDVTPGCWLGEIGVIDGGPATATVRATERSTLLELSRARLETLPYEDPAASAAIMDHLTRDLATRLRASSQGSFQRVQDGSWLLVPQAQRRTLWTRLMGVLGGYER